MAFRRQARAQAKHFASGDLLFSLGDDAEESDNISCSN